MDNTNPTNPTPPDEQPQEHQLIVDGFYYPPCDILMTLADGRVTQLAPKGVPIPLAEAKARGFIKSDDTPGPTEFKEIAETPEEVKQRIEDARTPNASRRVKIEGAAKK